MLKTRDERVSTAPWTPRSGLSLLATLFNRRWWWSTLLVLLGMAVLIRLGFWQLDRLAERRAYNAETAQQLALPPLSLTGESLPDDLTNLKTRRATAHGEFDFSRQVALKHQNWMNAPGIHLITPLVIEGSSRAVLVDRGWVPTDQAAAENWSQFDESGPVTVTGFIQLSQTLPEDSANTGQSMPAGPQSEWYRVDIGAIQTQMPYELLPIYILQSPSGDNSRLPYRVEPEFDLSDGPHLGYAIQWYIFALILGVIYVRYVVNFKSDC
jgi:surfeit locus 1 family protein